MDDETRHLHLRGALGAVKTAMLGGKEHLVVPVIALMDGVIHAVNASSPERVTAKTLAKAASSWNGRPLVLGHPTRNGRQCSANDPEIEASHRFGTIFNSRMQGSRLLMDAYVDPDLALRVGGSEFVRKIRAGEQIEVSVGAYVQTSPEEGLYNGKPYKGTWLETHGDHLAFLPGGRGACSIEMGCGAHRAAEMYLVTAAGFEAKKPCDQCDGTGQVKNEKKQGDCPSCGGSGYRTAEAVNQEDQMKKEAAIKALTSCPCSGFVAADAKELEAFSEERLTAMAEASAARAAEKKQGETDLKAAQDKLTTATTEVATLKAAAEKQPTEEEAYAKLPASLKTLVDKQKATEAAEKDALVTSLKTASNALTEDQLKAKTIDELKVLASFAKVEVPDYSGKPIPGMRAASDVKQFTPPDPYDAGIKALRAAR